MPSTAEKNVDVLDYDSAHLYLKTLLAEKSQRGKGSLRAFAQWSGIRSPATLSLILRGQRSISPDVEDKLIHYLKLSGTRKRYLKALSALTRTRDPEGRLALNEELFYIKHLAQAKQLEVKQYEFLSRWYYSVIYVLVGMPNFKLDPEWISQRLGRYVSTKNVEIAIQDMLDLNLLEKQGNTLKQVSGTVLKTEEEVRHLSIRQFHRRMIELGGRSLSLPQDTREITGLTVGCPKAQLPTVKQMIRQFREDLDAYLDKQQDQADDVYQLNIQFFPLTFKERS